MMPELAQSGAMLPRKNSRSGHTWGSMIVIFFHAQWVHSTRLQSLAHLTISMPMPYSPAC